MYEVEIETKKEKIKKEIKDIIELPKELENINYVGVKVKKKIKKDAIKNERR